MSDLPCQTHADLFFADAQAQRASGEAEYVRSLYAYRIAVAELERAVGQELVAP